MSSSIFSTLNGMDLQPGEHLVDGQTIRQALAPQQANPQLTALAGGGAAGATQLGQGINNVAVCASTGDSLLLPVALQGMMVIVINNGAQSAYVYPAQSNPQNALSAADTIVPIGGSTASDSVVAANAIASFFCYKPGYWKATV